MALIKIQAGAEVDLATGGELADMGDSILDELRGGKPELPRHFTRISGTSSATSATIPFQITIGGPPTGHTWDILLFTTCGADDHTVVAGNVAFYVGNAGAPSLLDLRVPAMLIPDSDKIGSRRLFVPSGQSIYAMVSGVPNNTVVNAFATIAEYRTVDVIASGLR